MVAATLGRVKSQRSGLAVTALVAVAVFWVAFDAASYGLESRATLAIAVWWTILMAIVLGLWPLARPGRAAYMAGGFLAALALFTAASMAWAESAERAFTEANRVTLFLGVFALAVLAGSRGNARRWADGLTLATVAIGLLALASRLFPEWLPAGDVPDFLPSAFSRLSWPLEYWNGLAIFVALGIPLLLRTATDAERLVTRGLAVGVIPALTAMLYLTSSRGGFATAFAGIVVFWILTPRRLQAGLAVFVAVAGSAAAVLVLLGRDDLVNDPFVPDAIGQGRSAALLLVLVCVVTGVVWVLGIRYLGGIKVPEQATWIAAGFVALVIVVTVVASHPVGRVETFCQKPGTEAAGEEGDDDFVRAHLLSGGGSGRCQFWETAVDEWKTKPVEGRGAGSYEAWWAQNGSYSYFLRDAHSLYLETLGELGVIGLLFMLGAIATGLTAGICRLRRSDGSERVLIAALLASFTGWILAAGIDWIWELTAVTVVGMLLLGLLTGPATAQGGPTSADQTRRTTRRRFATGVAALLVVWTLIIAQAIPLLAHVKISASQEAVRSGNAARALGNAEDARRLQPWAASPYLQLALVREAIDDLPGAHAAIENAIERDPLDWRLWLVRARIETNSGDIAAARESLSRAAELNPRSPLFANVP